MINKFILVTFILLLSSCKNNKSNNVRLVESNVYNISTNDIRLGNIRKNVFLKGKEGLRDALIKQSYRYIFSSAAIKKGFDKKKEVIEAIEKRQNKILSRKVIRDIKVSDVTDEEISQYFNDHINEYTKGQTYDLSFLSLECKSANQCHNKLEEMLTKTSFEQLSIEHKEANVRNGNYKNIDLSILNKSMQKVIENLSIGSTSNPIKYDDSNHFFIKLVDIRPETVLPLENYKLKIKSIIENQKQLKEIDIIKKLTIQKTPELLNINDENVILSYYARTINLDKTPEIKLLLDRARRWVLADYGYFDSFVFDGIDTEKVKDIAILNPKILKELSRFSVKVTTVNKAAYIQNESLNNDERNIKKFNLITNSEFIQQFSFLKIDLYSLPYKKQIEPIEYNGKLYWVYKSYQGLSTDNNQLLMDYKKHMRFIMGAYQSFMDQIGNEINLKINPIIYSDEWPKAASSYYAILQDNK